MCFKVKVMITHCLSFASWQKNESLFGHICHIQHKAIKCFSAFIYLLPSLPTPTSKPPEKEKVRTVWLKREADLTATRTICQTIWLLSSPDRREGCYVRKSRELKIWRPGSKSWFLPFSQCVTLPGLSHLIGNFWSPIRVSQWKASLQ